MSHYDLCVITRNVPVLGRTHLEVAQAALEGGATMIQLRDKELSSRGLLDLALELRRLTRAYQAALIVNDRMDIAIACEADGTHLGQEDLPIELARQAMGPQTLLGASVKTVEEAQAAQEAGASYLGVGPIFPTGSKADAGEAIGLERLAAIVRATSRPVLAIGGITCDNIADVIRAGAHGAAVIAAVAEAPDMQTATEELLRCIRNARLA
jgi:thiamine-phosphate pyrophosphorylase